MSQRTKMLLLMSILICVLASFASVATVYIAGAHEAHNYDPRCIFIRRGYTLHHYWDSRDVEHVACEKFVAVAEGER